ncbi:DUF262 domain-containing protein [Pseudaestuariivita rosea]|uniref:DUF262 domain-containing protein n=1 Tax=Pseudaestuariivita rosea TaxID=2763263 RepID=UPI001ABBBF33|nr:DUF262 domain-containing HNH endonuclease family protein [Pseudaestuariivita rosea]
MQKIGELFEAGASGPCQIVSLENNNIGFRIPEYQRPYDWSAGNIHRLMTDMFSGFERLSHTQKASAFTFLGTLIIVRDQKQEPKFGGKSYSIVDGQQRLTTLTLVACAMIERLRMLKHELPKFSSEVDEWLDVETDYITASLADCVTGEQKIRAKVYHPFPRIVRADDVRGDSVKEETWRSAIARFLTEFGKFVDSTETEFAMPDLGKTREATKIRDNFLMIREYCKHLNDETWCAENDCQFLDSGRFQFGGFKQLWEKTQDVLENDGSSAISAIQKEPEAQTFFRTLMLASYFCNCVVVTTVVTSDETAAFDIFDALNTTGEPLTALETLKPQVIVAANEASDHKYAGSDSEIAFNEIDEIMDQDYPETKQKQDETKDLIVTFSLYLEGRKVSRELSSQRSELHQSFRKSQAQKDGPAKFMKSLAGVARYRSDYWVSGNNGRINSYHPNPAEADEVKLLSSFIGAMKTSLALPILTRYWIEAQERGNFDDYVGSLKAVAAYLALRRAATGGTDGIDTSFRDVMEVGASARKMGLCAGPTHDNAILPLKDLKEGLRDKLNSSKVKFDTKEEWIGHVLDVPIYAHAKPLARFILFAATHHTDTHPAESGLLTRTGIAPSDDRAYLSFDQWHSERYLTVEHVAPNSDKPEGWDKDIYSNARHRNTIGNLVLLPVVENSSIGNATWSKKRIFYTALTGKTVKDRQNAMAQAKRDGMRFKEKTEKMIMNGERFSMLDGIPDVEKWTANFIQQRSRNLASLSWDILRAWLD